MTDERYERWKELLPDWVAGRLPPDQALEVERAVARDPELSEEAETLSRLLAARPEPPADLSHRISAAVLAERREGRGAPGVRGGTRGRVFLPVARWSLAAAAVAVLTFGALEVAERRWVPGPETGPLDQMALEEAPSPWLSETGTASGVPVLLDDLSDDDLNTLLQELGG
jgi:anti-sigma factor RsiW